MKGGGVKIASYHGDLAFNIHQLEGVFSNTVFGE